jgi:tyrosyl-tRNA synthetase
MRSPSVWIIAASTPSIDVPDIKPSAHTAPAIRFSSPPRAAIDRARCHATGSKAMTYRPRSDFLRTLEERGFVQDCTDYEGLDERLLAGPVAGYIGFDATATSLHVGSLIQIMMLRWLQKTGHRPICLMGGGTTKIGDPSFKDDARPLLDAARIADNMAGIRRVFDKYLDFGDGPTDAIMPDNDTWLSELKYIDFLRDYGRHFSVNRMLSFDSVRLRLDREQNLSFLEFNYMLLQAFDFLELNRRHGCALQMGGSDQWGNIVNGVDLSRRVDGATVFGLTSPLLTTADGKKMGKTAAGAVWLNEEMLSAYEFWQFWRNTADADVGRFLKLYTELPLDEIAKLAKLGGAEINEAKVVLANAVTTLAHGAAAAQAAEATARETFEKGGAGADLPSVTVALEGDTISVVQLFMKAGLASSGKDAKRLIAEGGARIDDQPVTDPAATIAAERLTAAPLKLSAGKKRHALARAAEAS